VEKAMGLDVDQADRLLLLIKGLENLTLEADQDGAEDILDELYLLLTKIYERFPALDVEEE
jgi:hypothetical protein